MAELFLQSSFPQQCNKPRLRVQTLEHRICFHIDKQTFASSYARSRKSSARSFLSKLKKDGPERIEEYPSGLRSSPSLWNLTLLHSLFRLLPSPPHVVPGLANPTVAARPATLDKKPAASWILPNLMVCQNHERSKSDSYFSQYPAVCNCLPRGLRLTWPS